MKSVINYYSHQKLRAATGVIEAILNVVAIVVISTFVAIVAIIAT